MSTAWDREMMLREEALAWAVIARESQLQREAAARSAMAVEDRRSQQVVDALGLAETIKRRQVSREKRERAKTSIILFEARRLNGNLIILRIQRQSKTSLTFLCYLPFTSLRFEKTITEEMVRCAAFVCAVTAPHRC